MTTTQALQLDLVGPPHCCPRQPLLRRPLPRRAAGRGLARGGGRWCRPQRPRGAGGGDLPRGRERCRRRSRHALRPCPCRGTRGPRRGAGDRHPRSPGREAALGGRWRHHWLAGAGRCAPVPGLRPPDEAGRRGRAPHAAADRRCFDLRPGDRLVIHTDGLGPFAEAALGLPLPPSSLAPRLLATAARGPDDALALVAELREAA